MKFWIWALPIATFAQPQYTINVANQQYELKTGFLKMGTNKNPKGDDFSYNNMYLTNNGKPWFPIMGELHYSRVASNDWESSILKMKAAGIQIISTYIFWNYQEEQEGVFDWSGNKNLKAFLTLCKKHDMYVWLRPGPWSHGEVRYGGFPDWLINKHIALRSNDSSYLQYVNRFFKAVAQQCYGLYFKDGGPIIGAQIENELVFKKPERYAHMKTLKQMLIAAGMDVPYYSAFAQGPDDQDEFLYMFGSYADSPWAINTKKLFKPVFFIKPLESDSDIGSDLFGKVDNRVRNTFPKLSAELGAGLQVTYHRRVIISAKDVAATAFTKLASGLNGLGYYMFHGGINAFGQTSLQESRATGYPNDVPLANYDFQSPIGAMGILAKSYNEFKLIHLFLNDFGEQLATEKTFFPEKMASSYFSYDTVQASVRMHENSGFIFLSNYKRFLDLPNAQNFQLHLTNAGQTENIPQKTTSFSANSFAIWPYHLKINNAILQYATAQPLCILKNKSEEAYVFFADSAIEFVFDKKNIVTIKPLLNSTLQSSTNILKVICNDNKTAVFTVTTKNKTTKFLILPGAQALQASKIKVGDKEILVLSNDNVLWDNEKLTLEHIDENPTTFVSVYPAISLKPKAKGFTVNASQTFPFTQYSLLANEKAQALVTTNEDKDALSNATTAKDATDFQDSILNYYAASKQFNKLQPGPLYQHHFHNLPNQHLYNININIPTNSLVKNWIADVYYQGDVMALYKSDTLAYDQFNYNDHCLYKFSNDVLVSKQKLQLQILPIKKDSDIYVDDNMREEKNNEWTDAKLKKITLKPIYDFELKIK